MILIGIFGAGGYAREVMPVARECAAELFREKKYELVFVDKEPTAEEVNGHRVLAEHEYFSEVYDAKYFNVAIADYKVRKKIASLAILKGAKPLFVKAANVIVMDGNTIGEGAVLSPSVIVTSNSQIGLFFHANLGSYVAHDCKIGDYVTFAPNVHCNGNILVEDYAYIGTGAILKHGTPDKPLIIGEGAVVGMGAVVTKDVPPYATVVGNPARPL